MLLKNQSSQLYPKNKRGVENKISERNLQIDLIKAFAIFSVILIHSVSETTLFATDMIFYAWQAVPLFIICSGIVWYLSFVKHGATLQKAYSLHYFKSKFGRLIIPFLVIFLVDLIYIRYTGMPFNLNHIVSRVEWLQPPISGAGDYYLALVWQLIFLAPILCYCFNKKPIWTVACLFIGNFVFELAGSRIPFDFYYFSICRYLATFALGLVLAHNINVNQGWKIKSKMNLFLLILGLVSAVYLYFFVNTTTPGFRPEWRTQNIYGSFYPALMVMIVLSVTPLTRFAEGLFGKISVFGRASYHIFLVQILYFGFGVFRLFGASTELWGVLVNLAVTFSVGLAFYAADSLVHQTYAKWSR